MKQKTIAKLVFIGDKEKLAAIKQRASTTTQVHNIDVKFSDVKEVKKVEKKATTKTSKTKSNK